MYNTSDHIYLPHIDGGGNYDGASSRYTQLNYTAMSNFCTARVPEYTAVRRRRQMLVARRQRVSSCGTWSPCNSEPQSTAAIWSAFARPSPAQTPRWNAEISQSRRTAGICVNTQWNGCCSRLRGLNTRRNAMIDYITGCSDGQLHRVFIVLHTKNNTQLTLIRTTLCNLAWWNFAHIQHVHRPI